MFDANTITNTIRKLLKPDEVQTIILRKTKRALAVERALRRDTLPYIKIGNRIYYDLRDLEKWLDAHRVVPVQEVR